MKVKICGITNLPDALLAVDAGAWALGFNFYKSSPRYIDKKKAKEIIARLPASVMKVGIFIDENLVEIAAMIDEIGLDLVQIYQDDNLSRQLKEKVILVLQPNLADDVPFKNWDQYAYILIDAPRTANSLYGGTGQTAQWEIARTLAKDSRLILAGGLNTHNVQAAIEVVHPFALDVASGTECSPGIKNPILIKQFLEKAQYES